MEQEDIVKYVEHTPDNTNTEVLRGMLNSLRKSTGSGADPENSLHTTHYIISTNLEDAGSLILYGGARVNYDFFMKFKDITSPTIILGNKDGAEGNFTRLSLAPLVFTSKNQLSFQYKKNGTWKSITPPVNNVLNGQLYYSVFVNTQPGVWDTDVMITIS